MATLLQPWAQSSLPLPVQQRCPCPRSRLLQPQAEALPRQEGGQVVHPATIDSTDDDSSTHPLSQPSGSPREEC